MPLEMSIVNKKRMEEELKPITDYREIFVDSSASEETERPAKRKRLDPFQTKGKKVLMSGEPGIGKSTLCKKILYDWAQGIFTAFTIVFLISLKIVKPGKSIAAIIIDQNPFLGGLDITETKLNKILESFTHKILIVLDGADEYDFNKIEEKSQDIVKIMTGKKLLHCNILITSRPHSLPEIEKRSVIFKTVIRVHGLTREGTENFIFKTVKNKSTQERVMLFFKDNFLRGQSSQASPMLLVFHLYPG